MHILAALVLSAGLLDVLAFGYGPLPALGVALDPGRGVWTSAADGVLPHQERLDLPGLAHPVSVSFTAAGIPQIRAGDDADLYLAQGYVTARFRFGQMDTLRRLGEGRLAALAGVQALSSDTFELQLGLMRTAEQEWAQTPRQSPAGQELLGYTRGVNDYLAQVRASGDWPAIFSLTGEYPASWTPVDSLVIQEVLTQELSLSLQPLDYALLVRTLGAARTAAWFPVNPVNAQHPYDPGPYRYMGIAPITTSAAQAATPRRAVQASAGNAAPVTPAIAAAAGALLADAARLPAGQIRQYSDSNAWAANGPAVRGGGAMLAGDPHIPLTLPSTWYQVALDAPGLAVTGVSLPGEPGVVMGHNAHIAWSLTNVQNQSTLFYTEQTSPRRPGEYYWKGRWRRMRQVHYTIAVRGGAPASLTVNLTVHGPVMTQVGQTVAVDWMGNVPSPDVAVLSDISRAHDFAQFHAALAAWKAPTQNFVYADDSGNIGAVSAGYYPQVAHGDPRLPMPGTGSDDIIGVIPYAAVPQVYNPPGHVIATANQRPVGASYPYYIGTSADSYDPGYRAAEIYAYLRGHSAMAPADFAALQTSVTDALAREIVPRLLSALKGDAAASRAESMAIRELQGWDYAMTPGSAAAAIWGTFWPDYVKTVFKPWWTAAGVPMTRDPQGLAPDYVVQPNLDEDLEHWTLTDPGNPAFTPPGHRPQTSAQVMRLVFAAVVKRLSAKLGSSPRTWAWGRLHSTEIPSLTNAAGLGYGPRPAGGDLWTVNAASGYPTSSQGSSWRMIVTWAGHGRATARFAFPGGESENPASPWYGNLIAGWWHDQYLAMPPAGGQMAGTIGWSLRPGGRS
jgi:penicillin G amidase